jgi:prevent-host-death family protein
METVGAYEAKTRLAALLERVESGESVTITRHGVPIAQLVPFGRACRADVNSTIDEIERFRKGRRLTGVSIREMMEEGRA